MKQLTRDVMETVLGGDTPPPVGAMPYRPLVKRPHWGVNARTWPGDPADWV